MELANKNSFATSNFKEIKNETDTAHNFKSEKD